MQPDRCAELAACPLHHALCGARSPSRRFAGEVRFAMGWEFEIGIAATIRTGWEGGLPTPSPPASVAA